MTGFLIYDAKVAVLIVVFYMFYRLLLSKETFHRVNRVVLLSTALLSFVLPLCVITTHQTVVLDAVPVVSVGDLRPEVLYNRCTGHAESHLVVCMESHDAGTSQQALSASRWYYALCGQRRCATIQFLLLYCYEP